MNATNILIGAAAGSALMFMLDPAAGGRRRALVRDQVTRVTRKTRDGVDATTRDLVNRASGIAAAARGRWSPAPGDDAALAARVRARLGRASSHPRAVEVISEGGEVTLQGATLSKEHDAVVAAVGAVRGVVTVHDRLQQHDSADRIPSLQGEGRRPGPSLDILQRRWAPATRAVVALGLLASGAAIAASAAGLLDRTNGDYDMLFA
jgi:hypothetical protein